MNPDTANTDSAPEIAALRRQVFTLLVALIVVSGTLTVYLYRQASVAQKDLNALRPQAQQIMNIYGQNLQLMNDFVTKLVAYGEKHPDFVPVLRKYGIAPIPGVPAGTPASAVPATAPKK